MTEMGERIFSPPWCGVWLTSVLRSWQPRTIDVKLRLYGPYGLGKSIDLQYYFHHRSRGYSVEHFITLRPFLASPSLRTRSDSPQQGSFLVPSNTAESGTVRGIRLLCGGRRSSAGRRKETKKGRRRNELGPSRSCIAYVHFPTSCFCSALLLVLTFLISKSSSRARTTISSRAERPSRSCNRSRKSSSAAPASCPSKSSSTHSLPPPASVCGMRRSGTTARQGPHGEVQAQPVGDGRREGG